MSFVFPRHNEREGWPIDPDALNENFQDVLSEIQGNLGEHNWAQGAFTNTTHLNISEGEAPIVCQNTYHSGSAFDISGHSKTADPEVGTTAAAPAGQWKVPNSYGWSTIGEPLIGINPMSKTLTTRAGLLWIIASFQQHGNWSGWTATEGTELPGVQYGISIDGSIIHETIPGAMDTGNDRGGSAMGVRRFPYVLDAVYPVTPGSHQIEVKARLGQGRKEVSYDPADDFYLIDSYELIIIEIR